MKMMGVFTLMFIALATPSVAEITEIETVCSMFECYSIFSIDRDIKAIEGYSYKIIGETKKDEGRSYAYGDFIIHKGNIKDLEIEILKGNQIKVSGQIGGSTKNHWGFSLFDDRSQLHSIWWNSNYDLCANWTIEEINGTTRVMQPVIFNATGLENKTDNSADFRIINQPCFNLGSPLQYEILSNTSESVYFATFINASANANTSYSFYWSNNTPVTAVDNPHLFHYANNGTTTWISNDGDTIVSLNSANESLQFTPGGNNAWNSTAIPDTATGKLYTTAKMVIMAKNFIGFSVLDNRGGGFSYQNHVAWIRADSTNWLCVDDSGNQVITTANLDQWYLITINSTIPNLTASAGNEAGINNNWISCGRYEGGGSGVDSAEALGFNANIAKAQYKDIFSSNTSFNAYIAPLFMTMKGLEFRPPADVEYRVELVNPTPEHNITIGFDTDVIINLSANISGIGISTFKLEWNGVNISKADMGNYTEYRKADIENISSGNQYTYVGWVSTGVGENSTETRTLSISVFSQSELDAGIGGRINWGIILLFVVVSVLVYALIRH